MDVGSKRLITMGVRDNIKNSFDMETLNCNGPSQHCRRPFGLSQAAMGLLQHGAVAWPQLSLARVADGLQQPAIVEPIELGQRRRIPRELGRRLAHIGSPFSGISGKPRTVRSCDIACNSNNVVPRRCGRLPQLSEFLLPFCQTLQYGILTKERSALTSWTPYPALSGRNVAHNSACTSDLGF